MNFFKSIFSVRRKSKVLHYKPTEIGTSIRKSNPNSVSINHKPVSSKGQAGLSELPSHLHDPLQNPGHILGTNLAARHLVMLSFTLSSLPCSLSPLYHSPSAFAQAGHAFCHATSLQAVPWGAGLEARSVAAALTAERLAGEMQGS